MLSIIVDTCTMSKCTRPPSHTSLSLPLNFLEAGLEAPPSAEDRPLFQYTNN